MSDKTDSTQIIDTSQIKSHSVILYDAERISRAGIHNIRVPREVRGVKAIPVRGSVENAVQILSEEEMNRAGWFRQEAINAQSQV